VTETPLENLEIAADDQKLLLQSVNRIAVFSTQLGKPEWEVSRFSDPRVAVSELSMNGRMSAWSGNGNEVVCLQTHGIFAVLDAKNGAVTRSRTAAGGTRALAVAPSGPIMSASYTGSVSFWTASLKMIDVRPGISEEPRELVVSDDGKRVLACGKRGELALVTAESNTKMAGHKTDVRSVAVSADGRWGASGDASGVVILWDLAPTVPSAHQTRPFKRSVGSLSFTADGKWLAAVDWSGNLVVLRTADGSEVQRATLRGEQYSTALVAVRACHAHCCLMAASDDGVVFRLEL